LLQRRRQHGARRGLSESEPEGRGGSPTLALGSASLVLNFGGTRNVFYLLSGYSRLDFEKNAPYRFTDNAVHGALGDRVFLGDDAALRFEVRAIYAPSTEFASGDWAGHVVGSLGLSLFMGGDRKSTRLNSSHVAISYAVFCLKKKKSSNLSCSETSCVTTKT